MQVHASLETMAGDLAAVGYVFMVLSVALR